MNIQPLFPYPLTISDFNREYSETELSFIKSLELTGNINNRQSYNKNVLDCPELVDIKRFIEDEIEKYTAQVLCNSKVSLYITQSWVNVTNPGQSHHQHTHPNSFISGVMYFQVANSGNDAIKFSMPKRLYPLAVDPETFNLFNSITWAVPVQPQRLFLFPSSLPHEVPPITGDLMRVSLSFNTFIKGDIGNADSNYYLHL